MSASSDRFENVGSGRINVFRTTSLCPLTYFAGLRRTKSARWCKLDSGKCYPRTRSVSPSSFHLSTPSGLWPRCEGRRRRAVWGSSGSRSTRASYSQRGHPEFPYRPCSRGQKGGIKSSKGRSHTAGVPEGIAVDVVHADGVGVGTKGGEDCGDGLWAGECKCDVGM